MSLLLTSTFVLGLSQACGSTTVAPLDASFEVIPQCLTSIDQNGEKCDAPPSLLCYAAIPCSPTPQQANCTCGNAPVERRWQCTYSAGGGGVIAPGTHKCFNEIDAAPGVCPAAEPQVSLDSGIAPCNEPGLICTYKGVLCPDAGEPNTDTCQCSPTTSLTAADGAITSGADGGLVWNCERQLCLPTSDAAIPPPPDTGPIDTGAPDTGTTPEGGKDAKSGG